MSCSEHRTMVCASLSRLWRLLLTCVVLLSAGTVHAVLGEAADTVKADQVRFKGAHRQILVQRITTHQISLPDGSIVNQYVNAAGVVFAVSWRTRLKPNLATLLGPSFSAAAPSDRPDTGVAGSKAPRSVRHTNLVIHQGGRMNAFAGLAYVPNLVPKGFDADTLR